MKYLKTLFTFFKVRWLALPIWTRQLVMEVLETSVIAGAVYLYNVKIEGLPFSLDALSIVMLKAMAKTIRSHPEIPVYDYVNNHK